MRLLLFIVILFPLTNTIAQTPKLSTEQYVMKYKDYAIIEMYRTGVPASITLAQGILESQNGNSRLAREANNHFGIKCKTGWTGKTIIADDDTEGECFRAYESALESYEDHSNFLRVNWRYNECFKLEKTDYVNWAEGLRKAGYATNPKYNSLITGIIDRYELHQYDRAPKPDHVIPEYEQKNNNIPIVYAKEGETIESIARKNEMNSRQIYRYNDLPKGTPIDPGDILYLKPKRRKGSEEFHTVKEGENLHDVSQMYGIKLKHLYKKNHLDKGEEVAPGSTLYLQKKSEEKPAVITKEQRNLKKEEEKKKEENLKTDSLSMSSSEVIKDQPIEESVSVNKDFHIVKSGDNLYRISEKYQVFVEDILEWNGITSPDGISLGDKIYLTKEAASKAGRIVAAAPKKEVEKPLTVSKSKIHTVLKGETAYKICTQYKIKTQDLVEWNGLKDAGSIKEGQTLKVSQ